MLNPKADKRNQGNSDVRWRAILPKQRKPKRKGKAHRGRKWRNSGTNSTQQHAAWQLLAGAPLLLAMGPGNVIAGDGCRQQEAL